MVDKKHSVNSVELLLGQYRAKLIELYESGHTVKQLKLEFKMRGESISYALKQIYGDDAIRVNRYKRIAEKSKAYTGNRSHPKPTQDKLWYSVCKAPDWYTGTVRPNGYVYEHTIVYCATHNITELPKFCVIHHVDLNPWNNSPDNLQCMTRSAHQNLHNKIRRCNDYPHGEYTQVSGSAEHPTDEDDDIVCSM
jgi:hypothetical protein